MNEDAIQLLIEVSHRCLDELDTDEKLVPGCRFSTKCGFSLLNWCLPVFKSFSLLCYSRPSLKHIGKHNLYVNYLYVNLIHWLFDFFSHKFAIMNMLILFGSRHHFGLLSAEDYSLILHSILLFCQVNSCSFLKKFGHSLFNLFIYSLLFLMRSSEFSHKLSSIVS